jgi:Putative bacterial sensory transduction regulator
MKMLKQSGYTYKTHPSNTWSIELQRKNIGKIRVITSVGADIVVTFVVVAQKANIQKSVQFLETLASTNHEYDYVKIGLDKDGDLFLRIDTPSRLIDVKEFKRVVEQVGNSSDELFTRVSDSIRR